MKKKLKVGWEKAILQSIADSDGIATLNEIYKKVPMLIGESISQDFEHTIRAYIRRLKLDKKQIKQIGLSTYALVEIELKENIFENMGLEGFKNSFLHEIPRDKIHGYIEGILVELGNFKGYKTYSADKNVLFNGKRLSELVYYDRIPDFSYSDIVEQVSQIDVIWFKDRFPVKTFDVENSTNFKDAFLRAYQLRFFKSKFYFLADEKRQNNYNKKLQYAPFNQIKDGSSFIPYSEIYDIYKAIALDNPAIKKSVIFK